MNFPPLNSMPYDEWVAEYDRYLRQRRLVEERMESRERISRAADRVMLVAGVILLYAFVAMAVNDFAGWDWLTALTVWAGMVLSIFAVLIAASAMATFVPPFWRWLQGY